MSAEGQTLTRDQLALRWLVLPLSCLLMIGNYYAYDQPSALSAQLKDYFSDTQYAGKWQSYFALLYSVYSFPNVVLPFFGGYLCDKVGVRVMLIVFAAFITGGQAIFALGTSIKSIPVMLLGRVVFGVGGESLTVAQSALVSVWFQNKEFAMAMGINLSVARLGGVINNVLSPIFWKSSHFSMWFALILCGMSLFCCVILTPLDKYAERKIAKVNPKGAVIKVDEKISIFDARSFSLYFWLLTISCVVVYGCVLPFNNVAGTFLEKRNFIGEGEWTGDRTYIVPNDCESDCSTRTTTNTSAKSPCVFASGCVWNATAPVGEQCSEQPYCHALLQAESKANYVMSIPYIISACISPFLGFAVDKLGGRAVLATVAPAALIAVHATLGFTTVTPYAPLVGQGLAYSVFAASLWPSIPFVVEERHVGTAYGLLTAIQNGGMALFPVFVGEILGECNNDPPTNASQILTPTQYKNCQDSLDHYKYTETFFMALAVVGTAVGLFLNFWDYKHGWILNARKRTKVLPPGPATDDEKKPLIN